MAQNFQRDGKPRLKTKNQNGSSKTVTMKVSTNGWMVSIMRNTTTKIGKKMTMKNGKKNGQHGRKKPKKNKNAKTKNGKPIALTSSKTLLTTVTSTTLITVAAKNMNACATKTAKNTIALPTSRIKTYGAPFKVLRFGNVTTSLMTPGNSGTNTIMKVNHTTGLTKLRLRISVKIWKNSLNAQLMLKSSVKEPAGKSSIGIRANPTSKNACIGTRLGKTRTGNGNGFQSRAMRMKWIGKTSKMSIGKTQNRLKSSVKNSKKKILSMTRLKLCIKLTVMMTTVFKKHLLNQLVAFLAKLTASSTTR